MKGNQQTRLISYFQTPSTNNFPQKIQCWSRRRGKINWPIIPRAADEPQTLQQSSVGSSASASATANFQRRCPSSAGEQICPTPALLAAFPPAPAFASCLSRAEDPQPDIFCRVEGVTKDKIEQCRLSLPLLAFIWSCCLVSLQSPRTKPLWKQRLRFRPDSTAAPC